MAVARRCPTHLLPLSERLLCPHGHPVRAWLVTLDDVVVGAGRPTRLWLAPDFPARELLLYDLGAPYRVAAGVF